MNPLTRIKQILVELEHFRLEYTRVSKLINEYEIELTFLIARISILMAELSKLRSIKPSD